MNRVKVVVQAVSWKTNKIKVAGDWIRVSRDLPLIAFRVGQEHEVKIQSGIDGLPVVVSV